MSLVWGFLHSGLPSLHGTEKQESHSTTSLPGRMYEQMDLCASGMTLTLWRFAGLYINGLWIFTLSISWTSGSLVVQFSSEMLEKMMYNKKNWKREVPNMNIKKIKGKKIRMSLTYNGWRDFWEDYGHLINKTF